ncbi:1-pyrroline-5-carboxylate dehydrogenase [Psychromonas marina]|uniref:1-pyrroline-5-carboxylate dehydrogenase n=1 Tax=Psychromonas marina TaxID=88364 RepID=A0ABQ6E4V0_9GAMM|nr:hypothetical protein [Psychromonas marina]GLS92432.1 1-pyrroline-5-carboxylate dehydrogenase [Psychromonas marina]
MSEQVDNIIAHAHTNWNSWNKVSCSARTEVLLNWADDIEQLSTLGPAASKLVKYQIKNGLALIENEKVMPGPTGESNELYTSGRGVFVIHCSEDAPLSAIAAIASTSLLAGNCIILTLPNGKCENANQIKSTLINAGIPESVVQVSPIEIKNTLISDPSIAGLVYVGQLSESIQLNRLLAEKKGLLTQLILETELNSLNSIIDKYFILRFITEKTRTINITAVGGNAALLELGCGDI